MLSLYHMVKMIHTYVIFSRSITYENPHKSIENRKTANPHKFIEQREYKIIIIYGLLPGKSSEFTLNRAFSVKFKK